MSLGFSTEEQAKLDRTLLIYRWAMDLLLTRVRAISEDAAAFQDGSLIERFKGRIKTADSIAGKLAKLGLEPSVDNAVANLRDLAGIRIICSYTKDIHTMVELLRGLPDVTVIKEKDYVTAPKPSGYRSFHLIVQIPVRYSGGAQVVPVEFQVRTEAMDFWASLEHRVRYKYGGDIPQHLSDELVLCADKIAELDHRMYLIHDIISLINQDVSSSSQP
ncbi:MAG: GTP pyrophosphokinase family protein [Propionibacteriaceae bacterium]|jgi:putative GTP pyrophosphokinase|nr:GTP pyrophosphokinase family protein [Propionibacteriaceae bacterium]